MRKFKDHMHLNNNISVERNVGHINICICYDYEFNCYPITLTKKDAVRFAFEIIKQVIKNVFTSDR